jgi:hypothetical protein
MSEPLSAVHDISGGTTSPWTRGFGRCIVRRESVADDVYRAAGELDNPPLHA